MKIEWWELLGLLNKLSRTSLVRTCAQFALRFYCNGNETWCFSRKDQVEHVGRYARGLPVYLNNSMNIRAKQNIRYDRP